jgi:hypothetical protein
LIKIISTVDQLANIFTKGTSSAQFALLRSKLTVLLGPLSLRGDVKVVATEAPSHAVFVAATSPNPPHEDSAARIVKIPLTAKKEDTVVIMGFESNKTARQYNPIVHNNQILPYMMIRATKNQTISLDDDACQSSSNTFLR